MTETTMADLLNELIAIREGMATKADWNAMHQNLADGIQALLNGYRPLPANPPDNRIQDRFDTVSGRLLVAAEGMATKADWNAMHQNLADGIRELLNCYRPLPVERVWSYPPDEPPDSRMQDRFDTVNTRLLDRIEKLERDFENMAKLLRAADIGERRTRPDTGASSESVAIAASLRSCAQTILENNLGARGAAEYLEKYAETVITHGGSGSQPAAPSPDSSGTEQPTDVRVVDCYENYGHFKDKPDEK